MFTDQVRSFDLLYAHSRQEANDIADGAIRELFLGAPTRPVEIQYSRWERLLNWFRFQPVLNSLKAGFILAIILLSSAVAARYLSPLLGPSGELIYLIPALLVEIFCLFYILLSVFLPDLTWSTVSISERRRLTARIIIENWVNTRRDVDDLLPAFRASTDTLRGRRALVTGLISALGTLSTYVDLFAGTHLFSRNGIFSLLGVPPAYRTLAFCIVFGVLALAAFIAIFAPLNWRVQLEPHLIREVERYKLQGRASNEDRAEEAAEGNPPRAHR